MKFWRFIVLLLSIFALTSCIEIEDDPNTDNEQEDREEETNDDENGDSILTENYTGYRFAGENESNVRIAKAHDELIYTMSQTYASGVAFINGYNANMQNVYSIALPVEVDTNFVMFTGNGNLYLRSTSVQSGIIFYRINESLSTYERFYIEGSYYFDYSNIVLTTHDYIIISGRKVNGNGEFLVTRLDTEFRFVDQNTYVVEDAAHLTSVYSPRIINGKDLRITLQNSTPGVSEILTMDFDLNTKQVKIIFKFSSILAIKYLRNNGDILYYQLSSNELYKVDLEKTNVTSVFLLSFNGVVSLIASETEIYGTVKNTLDVPMTIVLKNGIYKYQKTNLNDVVVRINFANYLITSDGYYKVN